MKIRLPWKMRRSEEIHSSSISGEKWRTKAHWDHIFHKRERRQRWLSLAHNRRCPR